MTLIIGVDVDGVVADLHTEWLRRYNEDFNDTLKVEDIAHWGITEIVKPECGKQMFRYLDGGDIYDDVKPIKGARTAIAILRSRGSRVVFVSSCITGTADAKCRWLEQHGFLEHGKYTQRDFITSADKSLIKAHWLVDDRAETLDEFPGRTLLFDQPWNQLSNRHKRLHRWSEVTDIIK